MPRILVVEDSAAIRLLIRRRLERAGHLVDEAEDGCEAVEHLDSAESPHLMIVDENMPRLDGAGVLSKVRQSHPELPVVVVSARPEHEGSPGLAGADARFGKPIDFVRLLATVDSLIAENP